jgi:hypothetical protein
MKKSILIPIIILVAELSTAHVVYAQKVAKTFEFRFEEKWLRGLIEMPQRRAPDALVILVPGYGKTNFVEGNMFAMLRDKLVESGLAVCFWDKMGCGRSEGVFNASQPVNNSADEAVAALNLLKQEFPAIHSTGLWGISRAGWICPLINEKFPVSFWISVSGTDDKENFGYLMKANLAIAGKTEQEVRRLFVAWKAGHKLFCTGGSYENYLQAIEPLREDSTCRRLFGYTNEPKNTQQDEEAYRQEQKLYTANGYFDDKNGLWVYVKNFDHLLKKVNCPVLALFGANDSQTDWHKSKRLYEKIIGKNPRARLTIKVFTRCNHSMQKCATCAYREDLSGANWKACDGYYETMISWLRHQQIIR